MEPASMPSNAVWATSVHRRTRSAWAQAGSVEVLIWGFPNLGKHKGTLLGSRLYKQGMGDYIRGPLLHPGLTPGITRFTGVPYFRKPPIWVLGCVCCRSSPFRT